MNQKSAVSKTQMEDSMNDSFDISEPDNTDKPNKIPDSKPGPKIPTGLPKIVISLSCIGEKNKSKRSNQQI